MLLLQLCFNILSHIICHSLFFLSSTNHVKQWLPHSIRQISPDLNIQSKRFWSDRGWFDWNAPQITIRGSYCDGVSISSWCFCLDGDGPEGQWSGWSLTTDSKTLINTQTTCSTSHSSQTDLVIWSCSVSNCHLQFNKTFLDQELSQFCRLTSGHSW